MKRTCACRSLVFAAVAASGFFACVAGTGYLVEVNGRLVDVLEIPKPVHHVEVLKENAQPYAYAQFDIDKEVTVRVRTTAAITNAQPILPLSSGVTPLRRTAHELVFRMKPGRQLIVEPQGRLGALVLAANRPETDIPQKDDPNVVWIEPGRHRRNIKLGSNQTLYLAPGAIVEGNLRAVGTNMTIRGRGRFDGSCWGHYKGPGVHMARVMGCNIVIRDIALVSAWGWCLVLDKCENVTVENVKILGGHVLNDDGIDACHSRNVTVRDSFIRAQDDCLAVKYSGENYLAERCLVWNDAANAVRIGYECVKGKPFRNIVFRDIDIPHLSVVKRPTTDFWSNCAIYIQPSNECLMNNILFENVRFDAPEKGDILLKVLSVKIRDRYHKQDNPGYLDGLTLRNVAFPSVDDGTMLVHLEQRSKDFKIENILFDNVAAHGRTVLRGTAPVRRQP